MNKEQIIDLIKTDKVVVTFRKADGTKRMMLATLSEAYLPEAPQVDPTAPPKRTRMANPDVQNVWDIEAEGWRSFKWSTLISANGERFEVEPDKDAV